MADQDVDFSELLTEGEVLTPRDQLLDEIDAATGQYEQLNGLIASKQASARMYCWVTLGLGMVFWLVVFELYRPEWIGPQFRPLLLAAGLLLLFVVSQALMWMVEDGRQVRRLGRLVAPLAAAIEEAKAAIAEADMKATA